MGVGARRGGRARRRVHRRRHHHQVRRHHHHHNHNHHRRTGAHQGQGAHINFPVFFFGNRRRRAGAGVQTTTTTITPSSESATNDTVRWAPPWLAPCVVSFVLVTMIIVAFAVPAVPYPVGITCAFLFLLIIVVPFVSNVVQTRKAQRRSRAEPDVEAPNPAEEAPTTTEGAARRSGASAATEWVTQVLTSVNYTAEEEPNSAASTTSTIHGNFSVRNLGGTNGSGPPNTGYVYDPPPASFTEATAWPQPAAAPEAVDDASPQGLRPEPLAVFPAAEPGVAGAAEAQASSTDEPPPPSYEEAIAGDGDGTA